MESSQQSRPESLAEAVLNVSFGFLISWGMWLFIIAPLYGFDTNVTTSLSITGIFTVTSLLRSYVLRRWFNGLRLSNDPVPHTDRNPLIQLK